MNIDQLPNASFNQQILIDLLAEPMTFEEIKRVAFMRAMQECPSMRAVAERLGISLRCAYNMLHKYTGVPPGRQGQYVRT